MKLFELAHELERIRLIHGDESSNWDITLALRLEKLDKPGNEKRWIHKADMAFEEYPDRQTLVITGSNP